MADEKHLAILRQGVEAWNAWHREHASIIPDLRGADLRGVNLSRAELRWAELSKADLGGANLSMAVLGDADLGGADLRKAELRWTHLSKADLSGADLGGADLRSADLRWAVLHGADLSGADLRWAKLFKAALRGADLDGADLGRADLRKADLREADLGETDLRWADLLEAILGGADLGGAVLLQTILVGLDLSECEGLDTCLHYGPSFVDLHTLQRSGPLPLAFLRGIGLPDTLIDHMPSLLSQPIQMHSCFISYSSRDEEFARRLHADLRAEGVCCWFAPEDRKVGVEISDPTGEAFRLRDKVLLVLSERSIASDWVEDEVTKAYAEERRRGQLVLFPVRLDDAVFTTNEAWAGKLRDNRNVGDFRRWKEHDAYRKALERLLRDLRVEKA